MKRDNKLLNKRNEFVLNYYKEQKGKQIKNIVSELSEKLFLTERTIYSILTNALKP